MRAADHAAPNGQQTARYALRVARIKPGDILTFRALSEGYSGVLTHFWGQRSVYCPGEPRCLRTIHARPIVWKGYAAAEVLDPRAQLWWPCVLELTENAELDLRDRWCRGLEFTLTRAVSVHGEQRPTSVSLGVVCCDERLRPVFDIRPAVCSLYHVPALRIDVPNPLPARVFVEPSPAGDRGGDQSERNGKPASRDDVQRLLAEFRKRLSGGTEL
jgi:hypothetical protein